MVNPGLAQIKNEHQVAMAICTTRSVDTGETFLGIMYNSINLHEHIQSVLYQSME